MSNSIQEWPAFAPARSLRFGEIRYERGVWGKVPNTRTDFRWIAQSSGLHGDESLAQQISLGAEDQPPPTKAQLWRNRGNHCYAVGLYPSRAQDAVGRRNFLEKQVLAWSPSSGTPAAMGALLLLPQVATLNADIWWERSGDLTWVDSSFSLPLPSSENEPLPIRQEDLASTVRQGVDELHEVIKRENLTRMYAQILAGRPAWLTGLERPLSPRALAVLLLPLPRDLADSLSMAGWLPSNRLMLEDLASRWDMIVLPPHLEETVRSQGVDSEFEKQGWALAEALLNLDPELARAQTLLMVGTPVELRDILRPTEQLVEPSRIETRAPLSSLDSLRPDAMIALPSPPSNASDLLKELHAFACTVGRRWVDLDRLARKPVSKLESIPESLFSSWIIMLKQQKPGHVDGDQWKIKLDLLRSAALVLRPRADTLHRVGFPESRRIPVLLFALALGKRDLLAEMGDETLCQALQQSLDSQPSLWTKRLRSLIEQWQASTRSAGLKRLIRAALENAEG